MRLKYFIPVLAVLVLVFGCAKLPGVTKVGGDGGNGKGGTVVKSDNGVGLYYALPLTVAKVEMPLTLKYYLEESKDKSKKTVVTVRPIFSKASVTATSVPDPDHVYKFALNGTPFVDSKLLVKLSEAGILEYVGSGSVNHGSDVTAQFVRYAASLAAGWITGGITTPLPEIEGTSPALERSKLDPSKIIYDPLAVVPLGESERSSDIQRTVESDECKAQKILKTQALNAKKSILMGEVLQAAQSDALKVRLDGLDAIVQKVEKKCEGGQTKDYSIVFYVQPIGNEKGGVFKAPLLYLGKSTGYVRYLKSPFEVVAGVMASKYPLLQPGTDEYRTEIRKQYDEWMNSKDPAVVARRQNFIFVEVEPQNSAGTVLHAVAKGEPKGEQALFYRVPGMGKVSLTYRGDEIATASLPFAQYGAVAAIPPGASSKEISFDVQLYYNSGAINAFNENTTGHGAKDLKPYYDASADVLNAKMKQQQQQEAAEKAAKEAAAKSASTPATTPAAP